MKLTKVTVRIARHAGVDIEKTVPAWEVRVLNAIHGDGNVSQVIAEDYEGTFNADEVYGSLVRKYGSATDDEGKSILKMAYPDADALDRAFERMQTNKGRGQRQRASVDQEIVIP